MKKRLIPLVLVLSMIASLLPSLPVAAAGDVLYGMSVVPNRAVLNQKMMTNQNFIKTFANDMLNEASYYGFKKNMGAETNFFHQGTSERNDSMIDGNADRVRFGGTFEGDNHSGHVHGFWKSDANISMQYELSSGNFVSLQGPGGDSTQTRFYEENGSEFVSYQPSNDLYVSRGRSSSCDCGSPKFSKPVMNFGDATAPTIIGWHMTVSDDGSLMPQYRNGKTWADASDTDPSKWEDMYIHFEFSENIRFADNKKNHDNVYLALRIADRATGKAVDKVFYAQLYALRENALSFKLDTESFTDKNHRNYLKQELNHFISGFDGIFVEEGSTTLNALKQEDAFAFDYIIAKQSLSSVKDNSYYGALKKYMKESKNGMTHVSSLFTDLSGNPCATASIKNLVNTDYQVYIDSVNPFVESLELLVYDKQSNLVATEIQNGLEVNDYLQGGYILRFILKMSEEMDYAGNIPQISTNLMHKDGGAVTASQKKKWNAKDSVNDPLSKTYFSFDIRLSSNTMVAPSSLKEVGGQMVKVAEPVTVTEFNMSNVYDMHGNPLAAHPEDGTANAGKMIPSIDKKMKIDLLAPLAELNHSQNQAGEYIPTVIDDTTLRIDFTLRDDTSASEEHASGFVGVQAVYGELMLSDGDTSYSYSGVPFQYVIKNEGEDIPKDEEYLNGNLRSRISFPQITQDRVSSHHSLYLRLPDDFELRALPLYLILMPKDYVGITGRYAFVIDDSSIVDKLDHQSPTITITGSEVDYDAEANVGSVKASFQVYDKNYVSAASVKYAFVDKGATPQESDWIYAGAGANQTLVEVNDVAYTKEVLSAGKKDLDFYVYAEDATSNKNGIIHGPYSISYDYDYFPHNVTAEEQVYKQQPRFNVKGIRTGWYNTAWTWAFIRPENPEYFFGENGLFTNGEYLLTVRLVNANNANLLNPSVINAVRELDGWPLSYYGTYDEATRTFTPKEADLAYLKEVFSGQYYGKVKAFYMMGEDLLMDADYHFTCSRPIFTSREYEFWYAGEGVDQTESPETPPVISAEAKIIDGEALERPNWQPGDDGEGSLTSLAGEMIQVDITANLEPDFALDLLDTANSYVRLVDDTGAELYKETVNKGSMRLVIPDDITYTEGKHKVHLELYVKTSFGTEISKKYDSLNIYVDPGQLTDFGVAALITEMHDSSSLTLPDELNVWQKTDWYGYEKGHASATPEEDNSDKNYYRRPTRLVLNSHKSDIGIYHSHALVFTELSDVHGAEYIQVNNITQGVNHQGVWHNDPVDSINDVDGSTYYNIVVYDSLEALNAASHGESEIPVIADMDNTISYRKVRENGKQSPIYTMTIYPDTTMDETLIEMVPDNEGPLVNKVKGIIRSLPVGASLYHYTFDEDTYRTVWEKVTTTELPLYGAYSDAYGNLERFLIQDMEGNIGYYQVDPPQDLWTTPPSFAGYHSMMTPNVARINLNAYLADKTYLTDYGAKLNIAFDANYAEKLGMSKVTYDIPPMAEWNQEGRGGVHLFTPDDTNRWTGIYSFELTATDEGKGISIDNMQMVHKYDKNLAEGAKETVTLTLTLEDVVGNISMARDIVIDFTNTEPKIVSVEMKDNVFFTEVSDNRTFRVPTLRATVPMAEVYPSTYTGAKHHLYATSQYGDYWEKPFINVYRDGTHKLTFLDMFGDLYTETLRYEGVSYQNGTDADIYDLGMDLQFSEPDPVTGKVTLHYQSVDERIMVDIAQVTGKLHNQLSPTQSYEGSHTILAAKTNQAMVELDPDLPLYILMYDPDEMIYNNRLAYMGVMGGGSNSYVLIPNFVKLPIQADVEWYFDEFGTDSLPTLQDENGDSYIPTTTSRNVVAMLVTDRYVNGLNGKATQYTFTYGGETEYTFEFEDLSGVKGELTVSLSDIPITLTEPKVDAADTLAPEYSLDIYGMYNATFEAVNSFSSTATSGSAAEAVQQISWVQGYMLSFRIVDDSASKLIVKEAGADLSGLTYQSASSDAIPGITATGTQVVVNAAAAFDVVLIDANGNKTIIPFVAEAFRIDQEPPYIEKMDAVQTNLYEKTVYILLADRHTASDKIRWIYPTSAKKVTEGEYAGRIALVFGANQTINARFADELGNEGMEDITVDDLDSSTPKITKITWTPGNNRDSSQPPKNTLNTSVVALVEFDKQITNVNITDKYNDDWERYVDLVLQNNQAVITFKDSSFVYDDVLEKTLEKPWELTLEFTAVNGAVGRESLPALEATIDKEAPYAYTRYHDDASTPKVPYVDIVFEGLTEDCYMSDTGSKLYKAGQPITKRVTESGRHAFVFIDKAGNQSREVVEVTCIDKTPPLLLLKDLPDLDFFTNGSVKFSATMNEAGTITIGGVTKTVKAPKDQNGDGVFQNGECDWAEFEVTENGGYKIIAKDSVGLATESYISVTAIDRGKPNMSFTPKTYTFMQGTDKSYVESMLYSGVDVWDQVTKKEDIKVTFSDFDESLLSTVGIHPISFTATDKAGNQTKVSRYLKIFSATEPQITLNGVKTFRDEVTLLKDTQITVSVSRLPMGDGEPYTIYLRMGRWKEGQMKTMSEKLTTNTFTAEANKYYTVYIVTQSRGTYLTHFYVQ